jgi:hypothetical protein
MSPRPTTGVSMRSYNEYRCDERLKTKNEECTLLVSTGLFVELEHLKTKTRLIDEKFARTPEAAKKTVSFQMNL